MCSASTSSCPMAQVATPYFASLAWAFALALVFVPRYCLRKKTPPLPPGPRGLPFVGNVLDVPSENHWIKFAELAAIWGDILSLRVFGQTIIIINSVEIAEDLLDVRGANFSDRPVLPMAGELSGFNNALPMCQYDDRVRRERRLFHKLFGTQVSVKEFAPLISAEVQRFLRNVVASPEAVFDQIGRMTGAITLRIAYGYHTVDGPDLDPYLKEFETAGLNFLNATRMGEHLVDIWPALRYWPAWLPGGGFHATARAMSKQVHATVDIGLDFVKTQMAAGTAEPCFTTRFLEEAHDEYLVKWAAGVVQVAGGDTTASQLEGFFLAMTLYPAVQAAAQAEIDAVVGRGRLPGLADRAQLPYVDALCKEVLRWHVAAPTAVPHRARADFVYTYHGRDFFIPQDAMIIPNNWKMTHDPVRYRDPLAFDPRRYIGSDAEQDPARMCFGYGRRLCPGRLLADTVLFMACSTILAVFNISKMQQGGVVKEPRLGATSGTVSHPLPFECEVKIRSAQALELVRGD
ncbi:cytochrome P450 [Mycena pura]|uniref:Cytochrome P450 n=1 Tax=Mycena pura TaxID=153505 RepID=A0AAD6VSR8_9AGAR|nr:cytochrome P450 [Mycena pura]